MGKQFNFDQVPPVKTKAGLVKGYQFNGIYIFKGIPYAAAKRFQMPVETEPFEGIRDACSYGFVSPMLTRDNPTGELFVPHRYWPQDENCQNLNIWTKALDQEAKLPVMVWLHGGGFVAGSSIEQTAYDGANLCDYGDVVVVTINHRLNILGYMDVSCLGEQYANSANAGHGDMVAALKWIQENIRAFGGDPDRVTIFGQSGGGMKVTGLMQIPEADGLFHRGIVMSGVNDGKLLVPPKSDGRELTEALLQELGIAKGEEEKLAVVPYYELAQAYLKVSPAVAGKGGNVGCVPMPNDYYLGEPLLTGFREQAKKIPLMIGSVYGEFSFGMPSFDRAAISEKEEMEILEKAFGARSAEVAEVFKKTYPGKKLVDVLTLDRVFRAPSKELAKLHAASSDAGTYLYHFVLEYPMFHGKPAWHCSDIPFFFRNTDKVEVCNIEGVTDRLEEQICKAAVEFAKSGNPNHPQLPVWKKVTAGEEPTMIFDRECRVVNNYDDEILKLLDELLPPFSMAAMMEENVQH